MAKQKIVEKHSVAGVGILKYQDKELIISGKEYGDRKIVDLLKSFVGDEVKITCAKSDEIDSEEDNE